MQQGLAYAEQKWTRKTANAGTKWSQETQGKGSVMCQGVSEFIGQPAPGCNAAGYDAGVAAVGPAGFQSAIQGKGPKWARNYVAAMTGR